MNSEYPYIVVPINEVNKLLAKQKGLSDTFCKTYQIAQQVEERQNLYSGVKWKIKKITTEKINWQL